MRADQLGDDDQLGTVACTELRHGVAGAGVDADTSHTIKPIPTVRQGPEEAIATRSVIRTPTT